MKRWCVLLYGVVAYLMFHAVTIYAVLFVGNLWISNTLDSQPRTDFRTAMAINIGLLAVFAAQHSGMARNGFKQWIIQYIPQSAERSTYVQMSNFAMILVFAFWQPLGGTIWTIENPLAVNLVYSIYFVGWILLVLSTFAICHFDLFGLRQIWFYFRNQPYVHHEFRIPFLYKIVRHPIYVAWLIIFWAAPVMTASHLLFALVSTAYIMIAIQLEERDLVTAFGQTYTDYKRHVPMLVPGLHRMSDTVNEAPISVFDERFEERV